MLNRVKTHSNIRHCEINNQILTYKKICLLHIFKLSTVIKRLADIFSGWVGVVGKVMGLPIKSIDSDISNSSNDSTMEMKISIC